MPEHGPTDRPTASAALTAGTLDAVSDRARLRSTLRIPRGRYPAARAAQLSGVPQRTVYHWASTGLLVPDWVEHRPKQWSYRDLVYLRLVAWLRARDMPVDAVRQRVIAVRERIAADDDTVLRVRSDGHALLVGEEAVDRVSGEAPLPGLAPLDEFHLTVPAQVEELPRRSLWGPDLRTPSTRTTITPSVMGGDVCVRDTRMPTSSLYALHQVRRLPPEAIVALYPSLDVADVEDAVMLEDRLRRTGTPGTGAPEAARTAA